MMKKLIIIILVLGVLVGCSTDDSPNFFFDFVAVESVAEIPETFVVNQSDTLQVSYFRPSDCHGFDGFDVEKIDNAREITIVTKVINVDASCEELSNDLRVAPLVFRPEEAGNVELRFFNGTDADNNPIFLTFNVPIIE